MNKDIIKLNTKDVESKLITVRGQMVLLDRDVAELYGVQTREINQAVRNNPDKFPQGYVIELTKEESVVLRSKFLTLEQENNFAVKNFDHKTGRYSKYSYKAFTERGLYMLATILS